MNNCNRFWDLADHIPLDDVINYWCELSGHTDTKCREAKRAAICSAVDAGKVTYRRLDGKPYNDDVYRLASAGQLLIERKSFDAWAKQFDDSPVLDKPLGTRERDTLLKLVIGMAKGAYSYDPNQSKSDVPKEIVDDLARHGITVSPDTVRKYLKEGAEAVLPRKPSSP